ncbi:hypothetical protein J6590_093985 [Homalodisca vitripennis]|nr:hypothetical protein J6590_093985 [Homalodisca vitripennis]
MANLALTRPCTIQHEAELRIQMEHSKSHFSDLHPYETRGRDNYRTVNHKTVARELLPSKTFITFALRYFGHFLVSIIKSRFIDEIFVLIERTAHLISVQVMVPNESYIYSIIPECGERLQIN